MSPRSREAPAAPTRQRILAEAMRLFAKSGCDATSFADVAGAVGMRKQSIMHHYPTKHALRRAVLEQLLARWTDTIPQMLLAATDPRERIEVLLRGVMGFFSHDPDRARLILRELLDRPEEMREIVDQHSKIWVDAITAVIELGKEEGRVSAGVDPGAFVAFLTHALLTGAACTATIGAVMQESNEARVRQRTLEQLLRFGSAGLYWDPDQNPQS